MMDTKKVEEKDGEKEELIFWKMIFSMRREMVLTTIMVKKLTKIFMIKILYWTNSQRRKFNWKGYMKRFAKRLMDIRSFFLLSKHN
jgi:hypothetical protein